MMFLAMVAATSIMRRTDWSVHFWLRPKAALCLCGSKRSQRGMDGGVMDKETAIAHACSGPMLRGSLDRRKGDPFWDLRKLEPYCGYETYDFNAIIPPLLMTPAESVIGDAWHR